jgi:hypothetical protein
MPPGDAEVDRAPPWKPQTIGRVMRVMTYCKKPYGHQRDSTVLHYSIQCLWHDQRVIDQPEF